MTAISRGFLQGFSQGLYNNPKYALPKACMDPDFSADIADLYDVMMGKKLPHFLEVFNELY